MAACLNPTPEGAVRKPSGRHTDFRFEVKIVDLTYECQ